MTLTQVIVGQHGVPMPVGVSKFLIKPTFPIWRPPRPPVGATVVDFSTDSKPEQPAKGDISGISAPSVGQTIGGEVISAHLPTCRAHFTCLLARAGVLARQHGPGSRGRRLSIRARARPNRSRGTATSTTGSSTARQPSAL
jgi:hypothetical protein